MDNLVETLDKNEKNISIFLTAKIFIAYDILSNRNSFSVELIRF